MFVGHSLHMLIYIDQYTRTVEAKVLTNKTTGEILKSLKEITNRWGILIQIIMENGKESAISEFENWRLEYKISIHKTSPSNHQSNGKLHRLIKNNCEIQHVNVMLLKTL